MRVFLILGVSFLFFSCQKEVQLVKAGRTVDSTVVDHSPVYLFMETKGTDTIIDVNRKNTIGTTNWIFNIDKRLPLKLVIPEVIKLQQKREGAQLHKNEDAKNYFSYTDSVQKTLAFMSFKEISYAYNSYFSSFYVKENVDYHQHFQTFYVNFRKDSTVSVDGNEVEANELFDFLKEYTAFSGQGKRILIYLNFDEDLSFDNYLSKVIWLKELEHETCTIAPTHFIYNLKKLPDCNCTL
ncbi:hypothetical protein [Flavobacterium sp.]|jgi:hypothetical protein|uniref:hypothetical protein n=1 Tax=Flavobacterium sp. TaxID=239 RepID=UPI0037C0144A